ncbi:hypothetical protein TRAPUB_7606 [Trametes pubescens]|uniref:SAP domain-containing protein n=1 Tax=Trametes pubescens TaxID=154538 RepID=A0A1M2V2Z8_TRAPU|nr:hypothetical protein TRAPUB_7606 [Trametes pubescens]
MNREALSNLTRAEVRKLARRDHLKTKGTMEEMIDALLAKHDPFPVPSLAAIPATAGHGAPSSSRRMHGRQVRLHLASAPIAVRRGARRAANDPTQAASARKTRDASSEEQDTVSSAEDDAEEEGECMPLVEALLDGFLDCAELSDWRNMCPCGIHEHWNAPSAVEFRPFEVYRWDVGVKHEEASYSVQSWFEMSLPSSSAGSPEPYSPWTRGQNYEVGRQQSLAQFGGLSEELKAETPAAHWKTAVYQETKTHQ